MGAVRIWEGVRSRHNAHDCFTMTTPPSFSSFPPTFGSFPDLGAGSSKPKSSRSSPLAEQHKNKSKKVRRDKHGRDGRKESAEHDDNYRRGDSKKYRKDKDVDSEEKDTRRRADYSVESTADLASRSFYSDRKGDILNVTYGGLHKGDVPRYNMVSSEYCLYLDDDP